MSKAHDALAVFQQGFNCSQAVICAFAQECGISHETALKVAGGFGGGMGRMGEVCGALTGAFMVLGCQYGKTAPDENDKRVLCYKLVRELSRRFKERHGSIQCRELLGCAPAVSADAQHTQGELVTHSSRCAQFVRDAVVLLEELLAEQAA